MNLDRVRAVLKSLTEQAIRALLDDESALFWVNWRPEDETIADASERVLGQTTPGLNGTDISSKH